MSTSFKKLEVKQPPVVTQTKRFSEAKYWKSFKVDVETLKSAPVTSIHVSPTSPYDFAVTSGTRVQVYHGKHKTITHEFAKFKDITYSGSLRDDGQLICAGGKEGLVTVFDCATKTPLRKFRKNQGPVHVSRFVPNSTLLLTASDDHTVRLFDIPTQTQTSLFQGHTDHVRAAHTVDAHTIVSGGYDHRACLWDNRTNSATLWLDHGFPIDAVVPLPGGAMVATAGNTVIKLWDILAGGRLVAAFSNHHKNIACLCVDGEGKRLISGGLDHLVKIYSLSTHSVVAQMEFAAPVLSIATNASNESLMVGMASGMFMVRTRGITRATTINGKDVDDLEAFMPPVQRKRKGQRDDDDSVSSVGMLEAFSRPMKREKAFGGSQSWAFKPKDGPASETTNEVSLPNYKRLSAVDNYLRKFQYQRALDHALTAPPIVVLSLFEELFQRDGVARAVSGRTDTELTPLLRYLVKNITNPLYTSLLVKVANIVLDVYGSCVGQSVAVSELMQQLRDRVFVEANLQCKLMQLVGALDLVVTSQCLDVASLHTNRAVHSVEGNSTQTARLAPLETENADG